MIIINRFERFLKENNLIVVGDLKGKKFLVDPGHGGSDPGAVANGLVERDINLPMALEFGSFLKFLGAEIIYTRTNNEENPSLRERANMAINNNVDFNFPQHNNAGGGKDFEVFHTIYTENSQGDEMAKAIAKAVDKYSHQDIRRVTSWENSQGEDYLAIHRYTKHITTVLMEGGFLDGDIEDIDTFEERQTIAFAEALGVASYYGIIKEGSELPDNDITLALQQIVDAIETIINKKKGC